MTERFQPGGVTHALVSGLVELALASATRAAMASITLSLAWLISAREASGSRPRSIGGPARSTTRMPRRNGPSLPRVNSSWAPHWPTGTTGAPVRAASRATPFLATIGEKSGLRVVVPSG